MTELATPEAPPESPPDKRSRPDGWREELRDRALNSALRKRAAGVPTYTVPETAALMSISQEYLYRLIQGDGFPAVRMRIASEPGRYVVPAKAVERLLDLATESGTCIESAEFTAEWHQRIAGGAA